MYFIGIPRHRLVNIILGYVLKKVGKIALNQGLLVRYFTIIFSQLAKQRHLVAVAAVAIGGSVSYTILVFIVV